MASIGNLDSEYEPHPIKATMNNPTMNLFFTEKLIMRSIIMYYLTYFNNSLHFLGFLLNSIRKGQRKDKMQDYLPIT